MTDKPKPPPPRVPFLNRKGRRALKRPRLKLLPGGKHPDAPTVDVTQPAGRFALALHTFMVRYLAANADLPPPDLVAASLQVASSFAVQLDGADPASFGRAAEFFFQGEWDARARRAPPPGAAG